MKGQKIMTYHFIRYLIEKEGRQILHSDMAHIEKTTHLPALDILHQFSRQLCFILHNMTVQRL